MVAISVDTDNTNKIIIVPSVTYINRRERWKKFGCVCVAGLSLSLLEPARAAELSPDNGVVRVEVETWPADGAFRRPDGIGNITAAYLAHDKERAPLTVTFNKDASVVTLQVPKAAPVET